MRVGGIHQLREVRCHGDRELLLGQLQTAPLGLRELEELLEVLRPDQPTPHLPAPVVPALGVVGLPKMAQILSRRSLAEISESGAVLSSITSCLPIRGVCCRATRSVRVASSSALLLFSLRISGRVAIGGGGVTVSIALVECPHARVPTPRRDDGAGRTGAARVERPRAAPVMTHGATHQDGPRGARRCPARETRTKKSAAPTAGTLRAAPRRSRSRGSCCSEVDRVRPRSPYLLPR